MTPLEVEFKLLPGKQLPEALEALRQAGLPPPEVARVQAEVVDIMQEISQFSGSH